MDLKLFALTACLLIGSACAQDNQDHDSLYTSLNDSGIGPDLNVGSDLDSTELGSLPRLDVSFLQKLIDDASDGSSMITSGIFVLSGPLIINKNMTLIGSPLAVIDAHGTSQMLQIDNPRASLTVENFLFIHGSGDYGGAITSQARSLTVRDCMFLDNLANYGAAIYQKGGNLQIENSTFEGNNATGWGAAIYDNGGDMQVESSKFTQNPGSLVICANGTRPRQAQVSVRDCNVSNNPGPYNGLNSGVGGAIACDNSTTLIEHCAVKGNKALVARQDFLGGVNAGLIFAGSNVTLNDTLIEGNKALYAVAIYVGLDSKVTINRCNIKDNSALRVLCQGGYTGGDDAGITIRKGSEVNMNEVTIEGNTAEGNSSAIGNAGTLNLNEGTIITRNTAKRYSAIDNSMSGILSMAKDAHIFNNYDVGKPGESIHSKGTLNIDAS
jgi:hypothetical protein